MCKQSTIQAQSKVKAKSSQVRSSQNKIKSKPVKPSQKQTRVLKSQAIPAQPKAIMGNQVKIRQAESSGLSQTARFCRKDTTLRCSALLHSTRLPCWIVCKIAKAEGLAVVVDVGESKKDFGPKPCLRMAQRLRFGGGRQAMRKERLLAHVGWLVTCIQKSNIKRGEGRGEGEGEKEREGRGEEEREES